MLYKTLGRAVMAGALLCAPLMGGDYDHIFDVVKSTWPERTKAMAFCNKDANQMTLLELADTAKARNISLVIIDFKDEKVYDKTVDKAIWKKPGFVLIIDDDGLLGGKAALTARLIARFQDKDVPVVGISPDVMKLGAVLSTGPGAADPVYGAKAIAKKMDLELPEKAVEVVAR